MPTINELLNRESLTQDEFRELSRRSRATQKGGGLYRFALPEGGTVDFTEQRDSSGNIHFVRDSDNQQNTSSQSQPTQNQQPNIQSVQEALAAGFQEGDTVPGRGVIGPGGEFQPVPGASDVTKGIEFAPQPSSVQTTEDRIEQARRQQEAINRVAEAFSQNQRSDVDDAVSSSDRVRSDESSIRGEIDSIAARGQQSIDQARATSEALQKELAQQEAELERRRQQEVENIERQFGQQQEQLDEAQEREFGSRRVALARIGGFLGQSASAVGNLRNLTEQHNREDSALEAKKSTAIQEAQNAITDKQFKIAKERINEAKRIEEDVFKRRKEFFDQALDLVKEQRQREEFDLQTRRFGLDLEKFDRQLQNDFIAQLNKTGTAVVNDEFLPTLEAMRDQRIAETQTVNVQVSENGVVSGVDKRTGNVVWRTEAGVGRAGSATPNINVRSIPDPVTGTPSAIEVTDRDTGEVQYKDPETGEIIDPSSVLLDEPQDPLDVYINNQIQDILFEGLEQGNHSVDTLEEGGFLDISE